jgi:hypothetical protein
MKKQMKLLISILLAIALTIPIFSTALASDKQTVDKAVSNAVEYMQNTVRTPQVGIIGGEWAVIGLARSGSNVPNVYFENYYRAVEAYVKERNGVLHENRYTEYSRLILAVTAIGYDPRDVAGYDLTLPLGDFERTLRQGINGPIWALIALDSLDYPLQINQSATIQATRDMYIEEILRRQTLDGGWNLTAGINGAVGENEMADPDITGMALQALAKYQDRQAVKTAIDKAVKVLSDMQGNDGGFSSWGDPNSESAVQVLVALCELGISFNDSRFVKNGNTILDNILSFQNANGGFNHTTGIGGNSQMASEQALYGLVAVQRAMDGKNSLYRMSDVVRRNPNALPQSETVAFLPGKHSDVSKTEVLHSGRTFSDITNHPSRISIESLAERGIINGKTENSFDPGATMTRAEFAAIITRGLNLPDRNISVFSDVPSSAWFARAVGTAYYYEIITGVSATVFNPNGTITKQEAAVMIARAARLCGMDISLDDVAIRNTLAPFGDYRTVASWAQESLAFCYSEGLLDDSEFDINPTTAITRGEIAEMLYRMLSKSNLL